MGIMGSAFGRALGGFGAGVASLSNKYIDEDLAQQRAQAMADIQVATAGKIRQADDEFKNDPTRIARDRATKRDDAIAAGATAQSVELNALANTTLQDARIASAVKTGAANRSEKVLDLQVEGKAKAEIEKQFGNDPLLLAARKKLALANHVDSADSVARAELARMEIGDRKRLGGLYDELARLDADTTMPEKDKAAKVRATTGQIMAIRGKNGQGGARDPELDTQTIVDERMNADGSTTKTTRKEVRKAGQGGGAADPLDDVAKELGASHKPGASGKQGSIVERAQAARPENTADNGISVVPAGYGTNSYRYRGKTYNSLGEAQAAKNAWDKQDPMDYFKTPL